MAPAPLLKVLSRLPNLGSDGEEERIKSPSHRAVSNLFIFTWILESFLYSLAKPSVYLKNGTGSNILVWKIVQTT